MANQCPLKALAGTFLSLAVSGSAEAACPPDVAVPCVATGSDTGPGFRIGNTGGGTGLQGETIGQAPNAGVVGITRDNSFGSIGYGVYGIAEATSNLNGSVGVAGYSANPTGVGVAGLGGNSGTGVSGSGGAYGVTGESYDGTGVVGTTRSASSYGVSALNNSTSSSAIAIKGNGNNGAGVRGEGGFAGIWGYSPGATGVGVIGTSNSSGGIGVWGTSTYGIAGYFSGPLQTSGNFYAAGTKSFQIDHPLDPEKKYLLHAAIESSEALNVYSGNVQLDGRGEAWVELPRWFDAINRGARYQLTAIGAPGPGLYVAQKVTKNRFKIAGGTAGGEVSWQITSQRNDPYMQQKPFQAELEKPKEEQGSYLFPQGYGQPESRSLDARRMANRRMSPNATFADPPLRPHPLLTSGSRNR